MCSSPKYVIIITPKEYKHCNFFFHWHLACFCYRIMASVEANKDINIKCLRIVLWCVVYGILCCRISVCLNSARLLGNSNKTTQKPRNPRFVFRWKNNECFGSGLRLIEINNYNRMASSMKFAPTPILW